MVSWWSCSNDTTAARSASSPAHASASNAVRSLTGRARARWKTSSSRGWGEFMAGSGDSSPKTRFCAERYQPDSKFLTANALMTLINANRARKISVHERRLAVSSSGFASALRMCRMGVYLTVKRSRPCQSVARRIGSDRRSPRPARPRAPCNGRRARGNSPPPRSASPARRIRRRHCSSAQRANGYTDCTRGGTAAPLRIQSAAAPIAVSRRAALRLVPRIATVPAVSFGPRCVQTWSSAPCGES